MCVAVRLRGSWRCVFMTVVSHPTTVGGAEEMCQILKCYFTNCIFVQSDQDRMKDNKRKEKKPSSDKSYTHFYSLRPDIRFHQEN